jgi:hypothetical protein
MRRRLVIGLAVALALAAGARWLPLRALFSDSESAAAGRSPQGEAAAEGALPAREPLAAPRGALFAAPPPPKAAAAAAAAEIKPTAPPVPYRVAGTIVQDGATKVVLARGERLLVIDEGDTLEGGYHVDKVGGDEVTLVYMALGTRERLRVATAAAEAPLPSAPAAAGGSLPPGRLRWEGPEQVKAGTPFNLALKLTSNEPLQATPLQLEYDAQALEAVAVRPGKFFGPDASFSYRINPSGSIVVRPVGPAAAAADAELIIVTFKPVRAAPAAEVRIVALQLQRAAGAPIPAEPLAAFRTAIIP